MLIFKVVEWEDILGNTQAWNVLIWFASMVALAEGLQKTGFVSWFAAGAAARLSGVTPLVAMILLVGIFFACHYLFASLTAHATAVLPVVLAAGLAVPGLNAKVYALLLCYSLGFMGVISPYATGPAPVYFASGYLSRKAFWTLGFVFGVLFLLILLAVGTPYLMTIYGTSLP
jgi:L-tartrate/succinate antiporter